MSFLRSNNDESKAAANFISAIVGSLLLVFVVEWIWPNVIPFSLFEFWKLEGSIGEVLKASWPIFAWGIGLTIIHSLVTRNGEDHNRNAENILVKGCLVSGSAGVFEEIIFRWLIFYSEIIGYKFLNVILFGIPAWIFLHVTGPVANFFTLGYLEPILFNGLGWAVGAAIISSNGKFRDGHIYLGVFGWINSWFAGMFLFYIMFQYGLFASILVHFLYDMFIFVVRYIDAAFERALGWA